MNTAAAVVSKLRDEGNDMAELLVMAMDSCLDTAKSVGAESWDAIAIGEWTTKDVVNHVTYEALWVTDLFEGKTIEQVGDKYDGDVVGDDPIGAFANSVAAAKSIVTRPGAMESTTYLSSGPTPGAEYAMQLFQDFLIHGWDIAIGSGQNATLDEKLLECCLPVAELTREIYAESGAFGDNHVVSPNADLQTRVLALLGRAT
ncbi:MAG: TIGR03086 family protein [Chloroflexi bacterium]|nr:TIGR03086 family protein [Chloroflexota bacterium]